MISGSKMPSADFVKFDSARGCVADRVGRWEALAVLACVFLISRRNEAGENACCELGVAALLFELCFCFSLGLGHFLGRGSDEGNSFSSVFFPLNFAAIGRFFFLELCLDDNRFLAEVGTRGSALEQFVRSLGESTIGFV